MNSNLYGLLLKKRSSKLQQDGIIHLLFLIKMIFMHVETVQRDNCKKFNLKYHSIFKFIFLED